MSQADDRVYPNQFFSTVALTDTAQDVGTVSTNLVAHEIILVGGDALEAVKFSNSAGSEYFTIQLPIGAVLNIGSANFDNTGLEVETLTAAVGVGCFISFSQ